MNKFNLDIAYHWVHSSRKAIGTISFLIVKWRWYEENFSYSPSSTVVVLWVIDYLISLVIGIGSISTGNRTAHTITWIFFYCVISTWITSTFRGWIRTGSSWADCATVPTRCWTCSYHLPWSHNTIHWKQFTKELTWVTSHITLYILHLFVKFVMLNIQQRLLFLIYKIYHSSRVNFSNDLVLLSP